MLFAHLTASKEKHYENMPIEIILKNLQPKNEKFSDKIRIFFIFLPKTKVVGSEAVSNEYSQSMFLSRNK